MKTKKQHKHKSPAPAANHSLLKIFGIEYQFTNEPLAFRTFVVLIFIASLLGLFYFTDEWLLAILGSRNAISAIARWISAAHERAP